MWAHAECVEFCSLVFMHALPWLKVTDDGCRSNMLGTQFTVYDSGSSPKFGSANKGGSAGVIGVRRELAALVYVSVHQRAASD